LLFLLLFFVEAKMSLEFSGKREATHAGSWYHDSPKRLRAELEGYFGECSGADELCAKPARAIVSPHAGYTYCGRTMARSYTALMGFLRSLPEGHVPTVVLMGPSHHSYLRTCGVTSFAQWDSPFGVCDVDQDVCNAIYKAMPDKSLTQLSRRLDENEHSLEMMVSFLLYAAERAGHPTVRIVPILIGEAPNARDIGRALSTLDEKIAIVVSSDFCHWGARFGYQVLPTPLTKEEAVWQRIERMDRAGADLIAKTDLDGFEEYLDQTDNTICGRRAISALLGMAKASKKEVTGKVLFYDQSSQCVNAARDSSVSYCSIAIYI